MRVLHFVNTLFGIEHLASTGNQITTSGGWLTALFSHLLSDTDIELACASFEKADQIRIYHKERIDCFAIPRGPASSLGLSNSSLSRCAELAEQWKPDLIHVHGTEEAYGLLSARNMVRCPLVISLQGLLGPCSEWYHYFGNRSLMQIAKMHRLLEFPALRGQMIGFMKIRRAAAREREIVAKNRFFFGRTEWDRAFVAAHNPAARYFHVGELLRDAFWGAQWDLDRVKRHQIIFTNAGHPRKGTEILLEAVRLLKPEFPDVKICIAGRISHRSGYGRYLRQRIDELDGAVAELGGVNALQMAEHLIGSHVFVSPSFIENSSNSLCEAQLLGMPVISTYVGGIPSLVEDGKTGLFFPAGDARMLASRIKSVFEDDDAAVKLGSQARETAKRRHDPDLVVRATVAAYERVLEAKHVG